VRFLRNKTENQYLLAIFHLSVKPISRSAGRSATAAAAYRSATKILDERTGEIHDYTRKGGIESIDIVLPDGAPAWASDRAKLWNAAEQAEKRKDSCVAREFEVALPAELSPAERRHLALAFAKEMANREGCGVDVAIHSPGKEGDNRNHHAHILRTTRQLDADGLGAKLDTERAGRKRKDDLEQVRERWAALSNQALARAGHSARIDHRSLQEQGIDREPAVHLGPSASAIERRGEVSQKTEHHQERQREAANAVAALTANSQARATAAIKEAAQATLDALEQIQIQIQADALAAEQAKAQARHEAAERARELALAARVEKLNQEKEDDAIRAAALAALRKSSSATDRACAVAVADHASIADHLGAARGNLGRAVEGAERRVSERHYGRVVEAVRGQFERVDRVVQQVADRIERVVRSVTSAADQVARQQARLALARQRAAAKPLGIDPRSYYHPDNVAKREAREAAAAAAKPAPEVVINTAKIERRPAEPLRPAAPLSPPKPTEQETQAKLLEGYREMQAQWDAAVVAERALYLKELTKQAYDKTVAHVAEHQAHLDAKPMLFGREKWEAQRQSFERRDTANNHEWKTLKDGHYPLREQDKEAVQKAVERRVRDKNPALAQSMPKVFEALQAERGRVAAERQAQFLKDMEQAREAHAERQSLRGKGRGFSR
jgi:hypothetical protein